MKLRHTRFSDSICHPEMRDKNIFFFITSKRTQTHTKYTTPDTTSSKSQNYTNTFAQIWICTKTSWEPQEVITVLWHSTSPAPKFTATTLKPDFKMKISSKETLSTFMFAFNRDHTHTLAGVSAAVCKTSKKKKKNVSYSHISIALS